MKIYSTQEMSRLHIYEVDGNGRQSQREADGRNMDEDAELEVVKVSNGCHNYVPSQPLTSDRMNSENSLQTVEVHLCHVFNQSSGESIVDTHMYRPDRQSEILDDNRSSIPVPPFQQGAFDSDSISNSNMESVANHNNNTSFLGDDLDDMDEVGDAKSEETDTDFYECLDAEGDGHNVNVKQHCGSGLLKNFVAPSRHVINGSAPCEINNNNNMPVLHKQKNFVVDYAHLRRSGYFLEKQNVPIQKEAPVGLITSNIKVTAPQIGQNDNLIHVAEWVNHLPEDALFLEDSEDELMGKHEICEMTRHELLGKYMTDEDHFKNMILEYGGAIKYTSKPVSPLTFSEVEAVLDVASEAVDNYLEKMHKDENYIENEYVCGKVLFPSDWETENDNASRYSTRSACNKKSSWFKNWLPLQTDVEENESGQAKVELGNLPEEHEQNETNQIVLEPYHGPVFVNGAVIEAGSYHPTLNKGLFENIIEEIKAVLRAIHQALRQKDVPAKPPPVSPASSFYQSCPINEDPEIQQLTELLQDKQQKKKSTSRTVFGLRNLDKSPRYNSAFRRRLRLPQPRQRNSGKIFRAINGWIQRDTNRPYYNNRFRSIQRLVDNDNPDQENRNRNSTNRPLPVIRVQYPPPKSKFLASTLGHIFTAMKSIVPFQIAPEPTPAIPANFATNTTENMRLKSGADFRVRRSLNGDVSVPTRYQAMKNNSVRQLRKHRNL